MAGSSPSGVPSRSQKRSPGAAGRPQSGQTAVSVPSSGGGPGWGVGSDESERPGTVGLVHVADPLSAIPRQVGAGAQLALGAGTQRAASERQPQQALASGAAGPVLHLRCQQQEARGQTMQLQRVD